MTARIGTRVRPGWRESYHGTTRMLLVGNHARGWWWWWWWSAKDTEYVSYQLQGCVDIDSGNGGLGIGMDNRILCHSRSSSPMWPPVSIIWHLIHPHIHTFTHPHPVYPRVSTKYHPIPRNSHLAVRLAWMGTCPPPKLPSHDPDSCYCHCRGWQLQYLNE